MGTDDTNCGPPLGASSVPAGGAPCDCTTAREKLHLFLDQEIDNASCAEIEKHIEDCSSCLTEYDVERIVKSLVNRSCAERAPEPLRDKVQFAIRQVEVRLESQP